jgi:thiol-disulfide isomerase/thioredoxin
MRGRFPVKPLILSAFVLLVCGAIYFSLAKSNGPNVQPKPEATGNWHGNNFEAVTIEGKRFSLSELSEKPVVVVHFWASWCGPCVNEFPAMIRFVESFKGEIHLVALSADQSDEDIRAFLKKIGVSPAPFIHIIRDQEGKVAGQFLAKMLPTSVILGKGLKVKKRLPGEVDWEDTNLRQVFKSYIDPR